MLGHFEGKRGRLENESLVHSIVLNSCRKCLPHHATATPPSWCPPLREMSAVSLMSFRRDSGFAFPFRHSCHHWLILTLGRCFNLSVPSEDKWADSQVCLGDYPLSIECFRFEEQFLSEACTVTDWLYPKEPSYVYISSCGEPLTFLLGK